MKNIVFLVVSFFIINSYAQISGTVANSNNRPLEGVNILVKGTQKGVQTNADGNFKINDIKGAQTLIISHVGYEKLEINVTAPKK